MEGTGGTGASGGGGAQGASGADAPPDQPPGTAFFIFQAWNQPGGIKCFAPWVAARANDGTLDIFADKDATWNDAAGTDPANDVHYWGVRLNRAVTLPDCPKAAWGPWDGKTDPETYRTTGGPVHYTHGDAILDAVDATANAAANAAGSALSTGVDLLELAIGLGIIGFVLTRGGK